MDAVIIGSRAVSQDPFREKQKESKYRKHIDSIATITNNKGHLGEGWPEEIKSMTETMRKSKSAARVFREREEKSELKKKNMGLLKRIWHLEPTIDSYHKNKFQHRSGSNWHHHQQQMSQIKQENQKIVQKMHTHNLEVKDYKKRLKEEIKEYIELREHVRKIKPQHAAKPKQRASSERKLAPGAPLKLQKIEHQAKEKIRTKGKEEEGLGE